MRIATPVFLDCSWRALAAGRIEYEQICAL